MRALGKPSVLPQSALLVRVRHHETGAAAFGGQEGFPNLSHMMSPAASTRQQGLVGPASICASCGIM